MTTARKRLDTMAVWAAEDDAERVDKALVHKTDERNVLLSRVMRPDPLRPQEFLAQVWVDVGHPFFFEHPVDHVPALLLIEAARQSVIIVAHRFYAVPLDTAFVILEAHFIFERYAELDQPLFISLTFEHLTFRGECLTDVELRAEFLQEQAMLGVNTGHVRLLWWAG
jgi:hypothetical protein